jgi:xanthine dehydrogenase accessory factor
MRDVLAEVGRWLGAGKAVALATAVDVWGSAPREPGARMAVNEDGEVAGSVSAGCVEGAVVEAALELLRSGGSRLLRFGVTNEEAWAVGLSCGGAIEIFVAVLERGELWHELCRRLASERLAVLATVVRGPGAGGQLLVDPDGATLGALGDPAVERRAEAAARALFASFGWARMRCTTPAGEADLFVEAFPPRPKLVIVGAVHVAISLVHLARTLGLRTCVVDPRSAFATPARFAHADELITDWPQQAFERAGLNEASYVAVLTHDPKLDLPALSLALRSRARYVGALGSRRTHAQRVQALREAGHSDEEIARIRAPIGLDLGGRRPEEIAVAILAEIVSAAHPKR